MYMSIWANFGARNQANKYYFGREKSSETFFGDFPTLLQRKIQERQQSNVCFFRGALTPPN